MSSLIPLILIVLSLGIIVVIIVRKFPQLTLLDVETIPEVIMEQKKDSLLKRRLAEKSKETHKKGQELITPIIRAWKNIQLAFRKYFGRVQMAVLERAEQRKKLEPKEKKMKKKAELLTLIQEGQFAFEQKKWEIAEQKFIAVIKLDPRSETAYLGLGEVYWEQENYTEAKETFLFLLRINPENTSAVTRLAEIYEEEGDKEKAIEYYQQAVILQDNKPNLFARLADLLLAVNKDDTAWEAIKQAVELEPENPKYLDSLVEISVLCGNKKEAVEAYQKLRMVNPENNKLAVLKEKIDKI